MPTRSGSLSMQFALPTRNPSEDNRPFGLSLSKPGKTPFDKLRAIGID